MVWSLRSKLRRENFNAAITIQFNGFRVSRITLEPRLRRAFFFFNQRRADGTARSLEALAYQEGLTELKMCSGAGKTGVGEQHRTVFRRWGLTSRRRVTLLVNLQGTEPGPEVTGNRISESSAKSRLLTDRAVQQWNGLLRRTESAQRVMQ